VATLTAVSEGLGTVGLFRYWTVGLASLITAAVELVWGRRAPVAAKPSPQSPAARTQAVVAGLAMLSAVLVAVPFVARVLAARDGTEDGDTLGYHLPFAVRFAQTGWLTRLHFTAPDDIVPFHPANSELLHGIGMLATHTAALSPYLNVGFLALAWLAGWCVGHRFGVSAVTASAVSVVAALPILASSQPGNAANDVAGVAWLLAAVALLVLGWREEPDDRWTDGVLVVAALAAGLAVGTKLTLLAPIGALTLGVIWLAGRGRRSRGAVRWSLGLLVGGGFWYLRNLVRIGNPVPGLHVPGLPAPKAALVDNFGFSVLHYATDTHVVSKVFRPGLNTAWGPVWPFLVLAVIATIVIGLMKGTALQRLVAAASALSLLAYLVTPTGAFGPPGAPTLFVANTRYAAPALALALVMLPTLRWLRSSWRPTALMLAFAVLVAVEQSGIGAWPSHYRAQSAALVAAVAVVAAAAAITARRISPDLLRRGLIVVVALVVAGAAVGGTQIDHSNSRTDGRSKPAFAAFQWAQGIHDSSIGFTGFFQQFPLYGADLSNGAQFVGDVHPDHSFTRTTDCQDWWRHLEAGHYRFVVVSPTFAGEGPPPETAWTRENPAARQILQSGLVSVFSLPADLVPFTNCS
ncbi:MAG: hypothetical protein QOC92_4865, partial [Acidimicrobiaceae bacterium]